MAILFKNNATTSLAAGILSGATSFKVSTGTGVLFPAIATSSGDYFIMTVINPSTEDYEIMKVINRNGDTFVVERGHQGTVAKDFPINSLVELRWTADQAQEVMNRTFDTSTLVPTSRTITTKAPLAGGGNLTANRQITLPGSTRANELLRTGTANSDPVWNKVQLATDVAGKLPLSGIQGSDTANTALVTRQPSEPPIWDKIDLTTDVKGVLPSQNGGVDTTPGSGAVVGITARVDYDGGSGGQMILSNIQPSSTLIRVDMTWTDQDGNQYSGSATNENPYVSVYNYGGGSITCRVYLRNARASLVNYLQYLSVTGGNIICGVGIY